MILKLLLVFLGGGLGSLGRYSIGQLTTRLTPSNIDASDTAYWLDLYPLATMLVNIIGCALIGFAMAWAIAKDQSHSSLMLFLVVGVLGGFTTFSSFGWETLELIQNQRLGLALIYVLLSLLLGLIGVFGGYTFGTFAFGQGAAS